MTRIIYIDGLEVELTRKRIKRMNMRIKEKHVDTNFIVDKQEKS